MLNQRLLIPFRGASILLVLLMTFSCGGSNNTRKSMPDGFTFDTILKTTPIKDQGKSELCWAYAMLATIETEHLMQGDSVNLSVDYVGRCYLRDLALEHFRTKGSSSMSMRGVAPMLINIIRKHGCLPYSSYYNHEPVNYIVLTHKVQKLVQSAVGMRQTEEIFARELDDLLDKEIGYLPKTVYMFGAEYTPIEFAHSVCRSNEYVTLTSNADYEYGKSIHLPYVDNVMNCRGINVHPDTLVAQTIRSLMAGHPVLWEGGPNDNHAIALIGVGHDKEGHTYFVGKNSWGTDNPTHGLMYITQKYLKHRTSMLVMPNQQN